MSTFCNWCGCSIWDEREKPYCADCELKCYQECKTCHKPYPLKKHFKLSEVRCNSCHRRHLKVKEKRKKRMMEGNVDDGALHLDADPLSPTPPSSPEVLSASDSVEDHDDRRGAGGMTTALSSIVNGDDANNVQGNDDDDDDDEVMKVEVDNKAVEHTIDQSMSAEKRKKNNKNKTIDITVGELIDKLSDNKKRKKASVEGKTKRKYTKKDTKGKTAELEEDFWRTFLAYKKSVGGKTPVLICPL